MGNCSQSTWEYIDSLRYQHRRWNENIRPILLTPYRKTASLKNMHELSRIDSRLHTFEAIDSVQVPDPRSWPLLCENPSSIASDFSSFQPDASLGLKVGAQVVLIRNLSVKKKLVNGSRGVVIDMQRTFDPLLLRNVELPVVRFNSGGVYIIGYHEFVTMQSSQFDMEGFDVKRLQIPLKLGWGITIHKSQGMTLDRVVLDLQRAFAPGHAYVAMSRVRSPQGLSLVNFGPESILVSRRAQQFYSSF